MRTLVIMRFDEPKGVIQHLSFIHMYSLPTTRFNGKLKVVLLMTVPDSLETLVVSLSNSPNLTLDGVPGSILDEEIKRKSSGEGCGSAYNIRRRYDSMNPNVR
jgi:hypothetical protein